MKSKFLLVLLTAILLQVGYASSAFAQDVTVTGTVTDADYNGTTRGVSTIEYMEGTIIPY